MRFIQMIFLAIGLALFLTPAVSALGGQEGTRGAQERPKVIPIKQIESRAARMFSGRVVGSRMRQFSKNRWVYELRILKKNGEVLSVTMDAQDGSVIGTRGGKR